MYNTTTEACAMYYRPIGRQRGCTFEFGTRCTYSPIILAPASLFFPCISLNVCMCLYTYTCRVLCVCVCLSLSLCATVTRLLRKCTCLFQSIRDTGTRLGRSSRFFISERGKGLSPLIELKIAPIENYKRHRVSRINYTPKHAEISRDAASPRS